MIVEYGKRYELRRPSEASARAASDNSDDSGADSAPDPLVGRARTPTGEVESGNVGFVFKRLYVKTILHVPSRAIESDQSPVHHHHHYTNHYFMKDNRK